VGGGGPTTARLTVELHKRSGRPPWPSPNPPLPLGGGGGGGGGFWPFVRSARDYQTMKRGPPGSVPLVVQTTFPHCIKTISYPTTPNAAGSNDPFERTPWPGPSITRFRAGATWQRPYHLWPMRDSTSGLRVQRRVSPADLNSNRTETIPLNRFKVPNAPSSGPWPPASSSLKQPPRHLRAQLRPSPSRTPAKRPSEDVRNQQRHSHANRANLKPPIPLVPLRFPQPKPRAIHRPIEHCAGRMAAPSPVPNGKSSFSFTFLSLFFRRGRGGSHSIWGGSAGAPREHS